MGAMNVVGTINGNIPKKYLISAEDLTIELSKGRESSYNKLDKL